MKKATDNKQRYKDAFDQIRLSEDAYRQIRNMEETNMKTIFKKIKKRKAIRTAMVSLASLAIVFLSANGIVYAATGDSILKQFKQHIIFYVNGVPTEADGIGSYHKDKDGNSYYEFNIDSNIDLPEQDSSGKKETSDNSNVEIGTFTINSAEDENFKTSVKQKNDKTYLIVDPEKGQPIEIDITKDFADGKATGTLKMNDIKHQYTVTGTIEEYSVEIERTDVLSSPEP